MSSRTWRRLSGVIAAIVLPILAVHWALLRYGPVSPDLLFLFGPNTAWMREQWWAGQVPLWNPLVLGGHPFVAELQTQAFYPPAALFLLPVAWVLGPYLVLHLGWLALGVHQLARMRGASRAGAMVGGLAAGLSPLAVENYQHPNMLCGLAWVPWLWALGLMLRTRVARRVLPWSAVAVACSILAGSPEATLWGVGGLLLLAGRPRWASWGGVALGVGLAGVTLGPFVELLRWSDRLAGVEPGEAARFALAAREVVDLALPFTRYDGGPSQHFQALIFLGAGVWALALAGARRRWGAVLLAGVLVVLALGEATPLFGVVVRWFPPAQWFRYPIKFLLPLPVLAAVGAGLEISRWSRGGASRGAAVLAGAVAAVALGGAAVLGGRGLAVSGGWVGLIAGGLWLSGRAPAPVRAWSVAAVLVLEAAVFQLGVGTQGAGRGAGPCLPSPAFHPVGRVRFDVDFEEASRKRALACEVGLPNANEAGGFAAVEGVVTPAPRGAFNAPGREDALSAVGTVVVARGAAVGGPVLFENEAFIAYRVAEPGPAAVAESGVGREPVTPRAKLPGGSSWELPAGTVRLRIFDVAFPGWEARAQGTTWPVERGGDGEQVIPVPPGTRALEVAYRPLSFRLGALVTAVSLLLLAWAWKRRGQPVAARSGG